MRFNWSLEGPRRPGGRGSGRRAPILLLVFGLAACGGTSERAPGSEAEAPSPGRPSAESRQPAPLALGRSIAGELGGGEVEEYSVDLEADQFLRILVEQQGVDVVLTLVDPGGSPILKVDAPTGARGSEEIVAVAAVPGRHRVEVVAYESGGAGRYVVTLAELRTASQEDRERADAAGVFSRANVSRWEGDFEAAVPLYEEAVDRFRARGDRAGELEALLGLARMYRVSLKDLARAATYYEAAVPMLEEQEDFVRLGTAMHLAGELAAEQGHLESALKWAERALAARERTGRLRDQASTLLLLGEVHTDLGLLQEAHSSFERAIDLWREVGAETSLAATLRQRGFLLLELGKFEEGLDDFRRALSIARTHDDTWTEVWTLVGMSRGYRRRHEIQLALRHLEEAWELFREIEDPRGRALLRNDFGSLYLQSGDTAEARRSFEEALEIFRQQDNELSQAVMLHNLGLVQASAGRPCEGLPFFRRALAIFGRVFGTVPTSHRQVLTLSEIAYAERDCGDASEAREHFERALAAIENLRNRPVSLDLRSSFFATKHRFFEAYVDLLMEIHSGEPSAGHDLDALAASERARARSLLDSLMEVGADLRRGADPGLVVREAELGRRLAALEEDPLEPDAGGAPAAVRAAGNGARRRTLLRELDEVRARIRSESPRYAALTQPRTLSAREIQTEVLDAETLLLEYDLGDERSFLWAVTPDAVTSFSLPGRGAIEALARRAYRLLTSSHRRSSRIRGEMVLAELSQLLLGPVAGELGDRRLLVVSEGALQYIPFGALYRPCPSNGDEARVAGGGCSREPLIVHHEIVTMPSASALAVLRRQLAERRPAPRSLAVLADPVFQPHDPRVARAEDEAPAAEAGTRGDVEAAAGDYERLTYSGREAETILARVPGGDALELVGFAATREAVLGGDLGEYRILHFATHGVLDEDHPELSRLVMSLVDENGRPRDNGFVFGHEILNLDLPAELVVLSACGTALGKNVRGEGIVGLTRSFLYAGTARVVVSLWNVNDLATARLMASFYRHLLEDRRPPAAALRAAQVELWKRTPAPFYWSGFVIQGEWKPVDYDPR